MPDDSNKRVKQDRSRVSQQEHEHDYQKEKKNREKGRLEFVEARR
jgi:hypothetical protein